LGAPPHTGVSATPGFGTAGHGRSFSGHLKRGGGGAPSEKQGKRNKRIWAGSWGCPLPLPRGGSLPGAVKGRQGGVRRGCSPFFWSDGTEGSALETKRGGAPRAPHQLPAASVIPLKNSRPRGAVSVKLRQFGQSSQEGGRGKEKKKTGEEEKGIAGSSHFHIRCRGKAGGARA